MKHPVKLLVALCLSASLAACASNTYTPSKGYYKVGKPYKIKGKTYHPKERYTHSEVGVASWYGPGFHGRQTANGERFDENALTAAHPTLQMPSFVRVTNLDNGKSIILRINDRGPFSGGRIIDVSKAAADQLGFRSKGLAKVRVDVLEKESKIITNAAKDRVDTTGSEIALNQTGKLDARFAAYAPVNMLEPAINTQPNIMVAHAGEYQTITDDSNNNAQFASYETMAQTASYGVPTPPPPHAIATAPVLQISQPIIETSAQTANFIPSNYVPVSATINPAHVPVSANGYFVQVGNYLSQGSANVLRDQMASYGNARIVPARPGDTKYFRVELGPVNEATQAQNLVDTLKNQGRQALVIHR